MNESDETLEQPTKDDPVLQAIAQLSKKMDEIRAELDNFKKDNDAQFENVRTGIVFNSVAFDRLKAEVLLMSANVKELTEEFRRGKGSFSLK